MVTRLIIMIQALIIAKTIITILILAILTITIVMVEESGARVLQLKRTLFSNNFRIWDLQFVIFCHDDYNGRNESL